MKREYDDNSYFNNKTWYQKIMHYNLQRKTPTCNSFYQTEVFYSTTLTFRSSSSFDIGLSCIIFPLSCELTLCSRAFVDDLAPLLPLVPYMMAL